MRANSKLKSSEYSVPILGLIFLRYADYKFTKAEQELKDKGSRRRGVSKADYQAKRVMYLLDIARFSYLVNLTESEDTGKTTNESMKTIEAENEKSSNILPQTYNRFENSLLIENNARRIKVLESMAQTIYQEWFVKFRFPGHRRVKMVESELDLIPEGWKIQNLFDIAEVTYGFP